MNTRRLAWLLSAAMFLSVLPHSAHAAAKDPLVLQSQQLQTPDFAGNVTYYYNREGNCLREIWKSEEDNTTRTVEYTYGSGNHPERKEIYLQGTLTEETLYDQQGNPTERRTYSSRGRLDSTTTFENDYDDAGNLVQCQEQTEIDGVLHCVQSNWTYRETEIRPYSPGDTFFFGSFEQDADTANGPEPIKWLVLHASGSKVLVISAEGLDSRRFHNTNQAVSWETCDLRTWLNEDFADSAFTREESRRIQPTSTGEELDSLFLLSLAEVKEYLPDNGSRLCMATGYALANNAYVNTTSGGSWWLLRSSGRNNKSVAAVYSDGKLDSGSTGVTETGGVVRPAMWLDLSDMTQFLPEQYSTTEYTLSQGVRSIICKERFHYDELGHLVQQYYEDSSGNWRTCDYTNTCHFQQLIHASGVWTESGMEETFPRDIYYSYDTAGRKIRELHLYPGGDGYTDYTWEYDDQGNLLKYSDQYRACEINTYAPLSKSLWKNQK